MLQILGSQDHDPSTLAPCNSHPPDFYPVKQKEMRSMDCGQNCSQDFKVPSYIMQL